MRPTCKNLFVWLAVSNLSALQLSSSQVERRRKEKKNAKHCSFLRRRQKRLMAKLYFLAALYTHTHARTPS